MSQASREPFARRASLLHVPSAATVCMMESVKEARANVERATVAITVSKE